MRQLTYTESFLEFAGFELYPTGGNCTAYVRMFDKDAAPQVIGWRVMVTKATDPNHPTRKNEPITVGLYDENDQCVCTYWVKGVHAAVAKATEFWTGKFERDHHHA